MKIKSFIAQIYADFARNKILKQNINGIENQQKVFTYLISKAKHTHFGKVHHFNKIKNYNDFKTNVPVVDYEGFKTYIEAIKQGKENVLWPGKPIYFCKTSGTTSGTKYIPISKDSISNHINAARNALLSYIAVSKNASFVDGKMIFLQGSPILNHQSNIPTGRLSGIVAHHVPAYLQKNRMPSFDINCIEDWEEKVKAIAQETLHHDMRLISGIPPWVQMYFDELLKQTGKQKVADIFPHFSLFVYGGVNFKPYKNKLYQTIGKEIDSVELFPASEGFFAFQDDYKTEGLLLVLNDGIFYEFIKADEFFSENPKRYSLAEIELNINYALIISTNAGLWGYSIGDTIKFISKKPYKILITGRIKHFTSAFGEHVIAEEVESALKESIPSSVSVIDFHVAPQVNPSENELPFHEWLIEFEQIPTNLNQIALKIDAAMCRQNVYYKDLIDGKVLQPLKITALPKGSFIEMMRQRGKLGGQNKTPRLANNRDVADLLLNSKKF
jgi:hypothetical protein